MKIKNFLKNLVKPVDREEMQNIKERRRMPEEMELESYLEQERRDDIRNAVMEKRKKHNSILGTFKPAHNLNKDVKDHFQQPKKTEGMFFKHRGIKRTNSLFFK